MKFICLLSILLTTLIAQINTLELAYTSCASFDYKIYCYGGYNGTSKDRGKFDITFYVLDLNRFSTKESKEEKWRLIEIKESFAKEERRYPQIVKLSEKQLLINGGDYYDLSTQTIIYDMDKQKWIKGVEYTEGNYGKRQMYSSASTYVPGKGAAFFGGYEYDINLNWTMNTNQNLSALVSSDNRSRKVGFTSLTYYDVTQAEPWIQPVQTNVPTAFSVRSTSVYNSEDKRIYFFGGVYLDTTLPEFNASNPFHHRFTYALYYDTVGKTWGNQTLSGTDIPSPRSYHTSLILPNSPNMMLLYGGQTPTTNEVPEDFFYTLNLKTFKWKKITFPGVQENVDLIRTGHGGVLVDNSTFVVVFGYNKKGDTSSRILAFDVSNPDSISFLPNYRHGSTRISKGGIGGIVIGVVAVIGLVIAFFVFRRTSKKEVRREEVKNEYDLAQTPTHQTEREIDWVEINKEYPHNPIYEYPDRNLALPFVDERKTASSNSLKNGMAIVPNLVGIVTPNVFPDESVSSSRSNDNSKSVGASKPDSTVIMLQPVSSSVSAPRVILPNPEWSREEKTQL